MPEFYVCLMHNLNVNCTDNVNWRKITESETYPNFINNILIQIFKKNGRFFKPQK